MGKCFIAFVQWTYHNLNICVGYINMFNIVFKYSNNLAQILVLNEGTGNIFQC